MNRCMTWNPIREGTQRIGYLRKSASEGQTTKNGEEGPGALSIPSVEKSILSLFLTQRHRSQPLLSPQ